MQIMHWKNNSVLILIAIIAIIAADMWYNRSVVLISEIIVLLSLEIMQSWKIILYILQKKTVK
jgi:uncharacterized protein YihD (DUF1040 family)